MFMQAAHTVSAPQLRKDDKIQFFPGDMYKSCNTCAFVASTTFPDKDNNDITQYACVPLELHMFVLGPIKCDAQVLAVLLTIKEWNADKTCLGSKTHLALYAPCAGTLQLPGAPHIPVSGSREDLHFRTNLPLQILNGNCKMSSAHVHLTLVNACDTITRALFDTSLALYLASCTGFVHVIDWTCLLRKKYLVAAGTGILVASTTKYQALVDPDTGTCKDDTKYLLCCGHTSCATCPDECGCASTSTSLDACSTDPTLFCA